MIAAAIRRSVSRKFMLAVLLTTTVALAVAGAALLLYDLQSFRTVNANDVTTLANILAQVSTPALEFNDAKVAQENLAQLRTRPGVRSAALYGPDGHVFARYDRANTPALAPPERPDADGVVVAGQRIYIFQRIARNGETLGTVYLSVGYPWLERATRFITILALVLLGSLVVAALVSWWLQAAVTKPILALTRAAHGVIRQRDFSMRVKKSTDDEVGVLVDAFNGMLQEVGDRAKALEESNQALQEAMADRLKADEAVRELNSTLEVRIASRTVELERAHEQLRHSQKMEAIGQLTGGVAHDFNNVLQVISGNLQLLQMGAAGNAQAQRRLETAAFAADRGAKLSAQLLAFARRQPLQPVPTNLGRVLRTMDELMRRALGESIQVEMVVAGGLWNTLVDPNQLENVILNLSINSRDAMQGGGRLTLELGNTMLDEQHVASEPGMRPGQYVLLAISDTGTGMPAEVIERAFEPFFTTKPEGQGTGLGLSMAYGFVKQSNGHIKIYSEPGAGTTIRIYLPRAFEKEIEFVNRAGEPIVGGTESVLIVEDDPSVRATVVDLLGGLGYQILQAPDGASAVRMLENGPPVDLLFTDVVMPGPVRSTELALRARELRPDIVVLFTSGYTQNAIVHSGRLDPGLELISKPYRREDLARKIRFLLNRRSQDLSDQASGASSAMPRQPSPQDPATLDAATVSNAEPGGVHANLLTETGVGNTASGANQHAPLQILVVEDNDDARAMVQELLLLLGHSVRVAATAEEALPMLGAGGVDVLMTDVSLPGMSGIDLARAALAQVHSPAALSVIFASGYGAVAIETLGFAATSLPKPYDLRQLQRVLHEARQSRITRSALLFQEAPWT